MFGEGGGGGDGFGEGDDGGFAVEGADEFLGVGEDYVQVERDEDAEGGVLVEGFATEMGCDYSF